MEQVSQNGRRKARPWTAEDQLTAEAMRAEGASWKVIGLKIGQSPGVVSCRLDPKIAEKRRESVRRYNEANRDKVNERMRMRARRRREANPEEDRERQRLYRKLNLERVRERERRYREANRDKRRVTQRRWRKANRDKVIDSKSRYYAANADKCRARSRLWAETNADRNRENQRRYYEANRDKLRQSCRQWRKANLQRALELSRRYYSGNRDRLREYARLYREVNSDEVKQAKRLYCKSNYVKVYECIRRWQKTNPGKVNEYARRRSAWKRAGRQRALLPATVPQIESRRALWRNRCGFCGVDAKHPRNHGLERLTIEHVLALKNHGIDEAGNLMPACKSCNCSKRDSPVETWYRRQLFFTESRWAKIQRHCSAAVAGQLPLALAG